jgi:ABC-type uncharacterized transport system ATPase subunit
MKPNVRALAGHKSEKLQRIWDHCVTGEVMLDSPQRVEPQRVSHRGELDITTVNVPVVAWWGVSFRSQVSVVFEQQTHADVHSVSSRRQLWAVYIFDERQVKRRISSRMPRISVTDRQLAQRLICLATWPDEHQICPYCRSR